MMTQTAMLTIRLLGTPDMHVNGNTVLAEHQKARALVFYLAATGAAHSRTHLATLLWSDSPAASARRSLRAALFQARHALQPFGLGDLILVAGDVLQLDLAAISCDLLHFRSLLAEGTEKALQQAIELYRGPLLTDIALPNAALFDEWLRLEDQRVNQLYIRTLLQLASSAEARQQWDNAIGYLQRLTQTDPLLEEAQQQLIQLYMRQGAVNQAVRQYQLFERELREKLHLAPTDATKILLQQALQQGNPQDSPVPAQTRGQPMPLVDREALLAQLNAIGQEVRAGQAITVLIHGDGGMGKTRLLQELLGQLAHSHPSWIVLRGTCSPFDTLISYGPFLEAFQGSALGDLSELLLAPAAEVHAEQLAYRILHALRRLAGGAPVVLAVDDLQWANSSTLTLFGLLSTRLRDLPLLLIGTAQRPETIPALQRLITIGRRHGQLRTLGLAPLAERAVRSLLERLPIDQAAIPALARWLYERSDGNPFVLSEMIAQLQADTILIHDGVAWQIDQGRWLRWRAAYALPETTYDLVAWRLRNIGSEALALLELLAVAGQPLPLVLIADVLAIADDQLLHQADDLISRRLLAEVSDGRLYLPHHVLQETLLQRMSHVRRRMLHRQLAQALAACPVLQTDLSEWEVAQQAVAGEDIELARSYGIPLLARLPHEQTGATTIDFLLHLHDLLRPSATLEEQAALVRAIADVQQSLGRVQDAMSWRQRAIGLARELGSSAALAISYLEMGDLALVINDDVVALQAAEAGLAACAQLPEHDPTSRRLLGRGHCLLGHALAIDGANITLAEHHLQEATAVYRLADDPYELCASLFELGNIAAQRGDLLAALELYEEAAQVAERGRNHYMHALACNNLAYHRLLLGWPKAAQRALEQGQRVAEAHDLLGALLFLTSTQGEIELYLARWDAAQRTFRQGLALAEELGNLERQAGYRAGGALAALGQNDATSALMLLEEALLLVEGRGYWHLRVRLQIWMAEALFADRRVPEAQQYLQVARTTAQLHGRVLLQMQAERLWARLLSALGDHVAATICFKQVMNMATTVDIPLEIARTQASLAYVLIASGDMQQGLTLIARARQSFVDHQALADLQMLE